MRFSRHACLAERSQCRGFAALSCCCGSACRAVASAAAFAVFAFGFDAAAFAALRLRRLVGGDGLEPPTLSV
jgi:hypothetical protein